MGLVTRLGISTVFESELQNLDGELQIIKCILPILLFNPFSTNRDL